MIVLTSACKRGKAVFFKATKGISVVILNFATNICDKKISIMLEFLTCIGICYYVFSNILNIKHISSF
ncbi:unknown [Klebsiella variicola CAG:634]|nr:unknown [Klebsiella variicola CAG:634]